MDQFRQDNSRQNDRSESARIGIDRACEFVDHLLKGEDIHFREHDNLKRKRELLREAIFTCSSIHEEETGRPCTDKIMKALELIDKKYPL